MTVSERIFELIKERGYTQKEFSKKTGIAESTISDWKKKGTNPVSDKILMICEVLEVSPYFLLSGAENKGERSRENRTPAVTGTSDTGEIMACYEALDAAGRKEALKYLKKLAGEGGSTAKEPAGTGAAVKSGDTEKPKDTAKPKAVVKPGDTEKPKDKAKPKDTAKPKATAKPAISHLPDIRTIASEEADYLIKASEEEDGNKKKKDKKDKSKDKGKDKDKKKKEKSKDKSKDKKKKKKGYLLDR
jgi:transcriptional regulator with XRE-family HTH domain